MLKKYTLIGLLGLMMVLAVSAFSSVNFQPTVNSAFSLAEPGFRVAHMWNGYYIPPMDVTGVLVVPGKLVLPVPSATALQIPHLWNRDLEMSLTGIRIPQIPHLWNRDLEMSLTGNQIPHLWNRDLEMSLTGNQMPPK